MPLIARESDEMDDLRRDMILAFGAGTVIIGWLLLLAAIGYEGRPEYLPVALILLAGSATGLWLRSAHCRLAVGVLIATWLAAITSFQWLAPDMPAQYFFPVAVIVSGLLISDVRVFVVATLASLLCAAVSVWQGMNLSDQGRVVAPILLIYLTAFLTWSGARQINVAWQWMHDSYYRAERLVEELRDERMSLARALKGLEQAYVRIERMNYALIEARSAAEEARQLKAEFAANVSHELRTPLNIIMGFSETMANAPETYGGVRWTPVLRSDIEQIYQNARHLSSLIDDILDLSALNVHRLGLTLEDANIRDVIEEAVALVHDLYRAKNLYLNVQADSDLPLLRMDTTRIRQVLINLLSNASRYTSEGGVTITARLVGPEIQVAVRDTGIGIAPKDVSRVFEDFGQVDGSISRMHRGTGLGVPLSKKLVEAHGGRMWLESQPGQGTTFYFALPVLWQYQPVPAESGVAAPIPLPTYRKAVLMVEPDPLLLRTARRRLSSYDVIEVRDATNLPTMVDHYQPVALIVDEPNLKRMIELPPWAQDASGDVPLLLLSLPGSLHAAQALGIEGFLIKPISREQLLDAIASLEAPVRSILVVDDDVQLIELFERMLQSAGAGYYVTGAPGGAEALARLHEEPVDLVLLDMVMPEVGGLEVLASMKANPSLAQIPVIAIGAQYPETTSAGAGLLLSLVHPQSTSIAETLDCLQGLLGKLPSRGLTAERARPASSPTPGDLPAS